jgi:hypothetical protein
MKDGKQQVKDQDSSVQVTSGSADKAADAEPDEDWVKYAEIRDRGSFRRDPGSR